MNSQYKEVYAELHCLSNLSFLRGASEPEELVERAMSLGYSALALTDECSVGGMVRAFVRAKAVGLPLIVGSELRLQDGLSVVVLARDRQGYGDLSELISYGRRNAEKGHYRLLREDLLRLNQCFLLWLPPLDIEQQKKQGEWLQTHFKQRVWLSVALLGGPDDRAWLSQCQTLGRVLNMPLVASGDVHMHLRKRRFLQDTLTAIRLGKSLREVGKSLFANGERHLRSVDRLRRIYPPALLEQTRFIAARCRFALDELRYEYPKELVPEGRTPTSHLRDLTYQGLSRRFADAIPKSVEETIKKELALIAVLRFEPFFLTVYDLVRFARERGILCQGRGSAANSSVCFALGITEVDPSRMSMLFERFLSRERNEPPDIDVDFEHQRREEVIQYIYAKYGRERAAITGAIICYRPRSAIRDVGKALGMDEDQVARLSSSVSWWDGQQIDPDRLLDLGFDPEAAVMRLLMARVRDLIGTPRHLSQHVGGFVIARDKLTRLVPVENARMADRSVIQWDKEDLEALGLLKVDVLALGMLSAIRRGLDMLGMTMADVPAEDPAVYSMIAKAETIGVFQIESRAQMAMLPRLRPQTFYDLVVQVAIVRPGPIQGDMVHPYLSRRQGKEPVSYPSKVVRTVLERTLGVPIFQEQVMQLSMVAAGFTAGEADQLRRAMAAWKKRGGLEPFEDKLVNGMLQRGYSETFARRLFRQIQGFGEYGFPESHAASFALLVYVSAWIKCHHPAVFCCALLNAQPMGFYQPAQLVGDARKFGVKVLPVDVCFSHIDSHIGRVNEQAELRLGLRMVKGLSVNGMKSLLKAKSKVTFVDVRDMAYRAKLNKADLDALAASGSLRTLVGHRHQARWQVTGMDEPLALETQPRIQQEQAPPLPVPSAGDDLVADYARVGLSLGPHPLALLRSQLAKRGYRSAAEVLTQRHGSPGRVCGIVINRQRPYSAKGVIFMTIEDETGMVNVVVWKGTAERQRKALLGAQLMGVHGIVERAEGVVHLVAGRLEDLSVLLGGVITRSRDFH